MKGEKLMKELWKDVTGYEGLYKVSNYGRVKSLNYKRMDKEAILKSFIDDKGYVRVGLYKNDKSKTYLVHRLVALAFIPNDDPINKTQINHKNEFEKDNNYVDNLEWCDSKYNINYGTRNQRSGEKHRKSVICITTGDMFDYISEVTEKYGIQYPSIIECCQGRRKSAGKHPITGEKLIWIYNDESLDDEYFLNDDFANPLWFLNEEIVQCGLN